VELRPTCLVSLMTPHCAPTTPSAFRWKSHGGNERRIVWDPIGEQHLVNAILQQHVVINNHTTAPFHPRQTEMS
jgi:hypothetical protein